MRQRYQRSFRPAGATCGTRGSMTTSTKYGGYYAQATDHMGAAGRAGVRRVDRMWWSDAGRGQHHRASGSTREQYERASRGSQQRAGILAAVGAA